MAFANFLLILLFLCSYVAAQNDAFCDNLATLDIKGIYLYKNTVRMLTSEKLYEISNFSMTLPSYHTEIKDSRAWIGDLGLGSVARQIPSNDKIRWAGMAIGVSYVQTIPDPNIKFFVGAEMIRTKATEMQVAHHFIDDLVFMYEPATETPVVIWDAWIDCPKECLAEGNLPQRVFNSQLKHYFWMVLSPSKDEISFSTSHSSWALFSKKLPVGYRIPGQAELEVFDVTKRKVYRLKYPSKFTNGAFLGPDNPVEKMSINNGIPFRRYFNCPEPTRSPSGGSDPTDDYPDAALPSNMESSPQPEVPKVMGIPRAQFILYCCMAGVPLTILAACAFIFCCCCTRAQIGHHMSRVSQAFRGRGKATAAGKGDAAKRDKWWPKGNGLGGGAGGGGGALSTASSAISSTASTSTIYTKQTKKDDTRGRKAPPPPPPSSSAYSETSAVKYSPAPRRTKPRTPPKPQPQRTPVDKKKGKRNRYG